MSPITLSPGCYQTLELSLHSMDVFTSHSQCAFNKTFSDLHTLPAKRLSQEETVGTSLSFSGVAYEQLRQT